MIILRQKGYADQDINIKSSSENLKTALRNDNWATKQAQMNDRYNKIFDKTQGIGQQKQYSKQDREVVPADIVKKVKDGGGVIQKDHNGDWRIVSMKTNPPTFWDAHYDSKALASKALGGYFANK